MLQQNNIAIISCRQPKNGLIQLLPNRTVCLARAAFR